MPESYTPEQRKPQLIWQGRHTVRRAEPLPAQVVEVVRPNQEALSEVAGDLLQGRLSLLGSLPIAYSCRVAGSKSRPTLPARQEEAPPLRSRP